MTMAGSQLFERLAHTREAGVRFLVAPPRLGQKPEDAAVEWTLEETGLRVKITGFVGSLEFIEMKLLPNPMLWYSAIELKAAEQTIWNERGGRKLGG